MNHVLFWEAVRAELLAGEALMLLLVVESQGSSPGKPGFKMAVTTAGRVIGTIGGGTMEKELVDQAGALLARGSGRPRLLKLLHQEGAAGGRSAARRSASRSSGGICSGWQRVALLPMAGGDSGAVDSLLFALRRNRPGRLIFSPRGMEFIPRKRESGAAAFVMRSSGDWSFREEAGQRPVLAIIGGGHVGLALSRVMSGLDFHVRVLDDREDLATMETNAFAQEKSIVRYRNIGRHVEEGKESYAVIMTFGHQADEEVLGRLAAKKLRYLGLMGSPAKIAQIFARLKKKGVTEAQLKKVHAPVGLAIGSHTAEEIAISIAAEIIKIRNEASK
ncbi:MAG: XdhC family protein [Acidobacteria bacterium]|jgi:xanthine dehydrogenase accessory factor|nr:XdhC family protein [Acidobacteriota bacterium]